MGLIGSGEISDIAFYSRVERSFVLRPDTRVRYKLQMYGRFKDDGIVVFGPGADVVSFLAESWSSLRIFE